MKRVGLLIVKALAAATVVIVVADKLGPRLPQFLVVKGKDLRAYVAGGVAMGGLFLISHVAGLKKAAPVEATPIAAAA